MLLEVGEREGAEHFSHEKVLPPLSLFLLQRLYESFDAFESLGYVFD